MKHPSPHTTQYNADLALQETSAQCEQRRGRAAANREGATSPRCDIPAAAIIDATHPHPEKVK
jgi:GTP cyclohydrolase III